MLMSVNELVTDTAPSYKRAKCFAGMLGQKQNIETKVCERSSPSLALMYAF